MLKTLSGYSVLSLLSFCLFTFIFHSVVNAQTTGNPALLGQGRPEPTPTIFVLQTPSPQKQIVNVLPASATPTSLPSPTPTIYFAPTATPTITPSSAKTTTTVPTETPPITPTSTPFPTPTLQPTVAVVSDLETLFTKYSEEYHADKELLKRIARCESGFNTTSNNSGMYLGMFQFAAQTWINARTAMGVDSNPDLRTNAEEAIKTAAYMIANGRQASWPNCH
jgi:hypothetical protein